MATTPCSSCSIAKCNSGTTSVHSPYIWFSAPQQGSQRWRRSSPARRSGGHLSNRALVAYAQQRGRGPENGSAEHPDPAADLLFEQSRWRWPALRGRPPRTSPPPPPPPPPPAPQGPPRGLDVDSSFQGTRPPPPPPPLRPSPGASSTTPLPPWAEALVSRDPELRNLLAESPELWADLQRRAGKAGAGYMPPPGMPDPSVDPAAYERQVQQWLRYRRSQGGAGEQSAARQDDEIASLALLYTALTLPILAFAMTAAW